MVALPNAAGHGGTEGPQLLKAAEAAWMASISTRTLWRLVSAGKFPQPARIGGSTRWIREEIVAWIRSGCQPPSVGN